MKMETTAANLGAALKCVVPVVERRTTIPILSSVRIGKGRITATDLDMEASVALPTTGKMKGEAAIDCRSLSALVSHIPDDEAINISEEKSLATVAFNGAEYRLPSYPASDFPDFGEVKGETNQIGNAGLVEAMRRARFAVSTEETRYYLNGVCFLHIADAPYIVATNGHRLALHPIPFMPDGATGIIIPTCAVKFLTGRKAEPKSAVFDHEKNRARFDYDGLTFSAKLIDGTFPDVSRVIPSDATPYLTIDRAKALAALRRITMTFPANHAFYGRAVKISVSGAKAVITTNIPDAGDARETLSATAHGNPAEVGFNCRYLIDALSTLRGETVTFAATDGPTNEPTLITSDEDDMRIVQMPMRI